jgi:purine-binding chemotaxis protein CheW
MLDEVQLEDVTDSMKGRYLTFALGEEVFGIGINFVKEIIGLQPINPIPEAPEHIKGLINLRGKVFPVIDMRLHRQDLHYRDRYQREFCRAYCRPGCGGIVDER